MKTLSRTRTLVITALGFGIGVLSPLLACGGGDADGDDQLCTPGQQVACACPNNEVGVQACLLDGSGFDFCQCGDAGTGGDEDSGTAGETAETAGDDGTAECGNGLPEPGECTGNEPTCPEDCGVGDDSTGGDESTGGASGCAGMPIYVGMVPNMPSVWTSGMLTGYGAGTDLCQAMGADDVCEYQQVLDAEAAGEFAGMMAGQTAWLHRMTPANGVAAQPGGRCVDWTYGTNHISDGEFVEFGAAGAVTYNIDNDTTYDPAAGDPNPHVQVGQLECGGVNRAILCCNTCNSGN